ncbi:hypothetical protein YSA_04377 [Pseudomonas putida ND6]|uniref:Uncharacterized protein n=2 Tax=Pseudomonas putida TaxID=303 RepID=I3UUG5_PSEPU|nr:hypothetical protein YSA_04377 [Pseudomonas putida ND6]AFO50510.1 hypothetical protein T1E_4683 [Pseudomonas putida DOT-T1E]
MTTNMAPVYSAISRPHDLAGAPSLRYHPTPQRTPARMTR